MDFQKFFFIIMIFIPYPKTHVGLALYTTKMWVSRRDIFRFPLITPILTESSYSAQMILTSGDSFVASGQCIL